MPEDRDHGDAPTGSPTRGASGPAHDADRLDRLVMARVRRFIGLRDVLYFSTLGFLYSRSRRRPFAHEPRAEDSDR